MTAIVTRGDAADLHLPDASVDLIVTSPPYFGLRSYQDGGEHYEGQVGDEATPAEYLDALIACTREWVRVLKPGGSIFVNLGDAYARNGGGGAGSSDGKTGRNKGGRPPTKAPVGIREKSLTGLPWRYAIRCIDDLGLILRAEIVWAKPNGLPESVTDRVRRSHEQVFHFVKQPRYYSAVDEVREQYAPATFSRNLYARPNDHESAKNNGTLRAPRGAGMDANPLGKLPGSVWEIPTAPLRVPEHLGIDHFAAYPPELVRRIVLGWSPREVCTACGEGRRPVSERGELRPTVSRRAEYQMPRHSPDSKHGYGASSLGFVRDSSIVGYVCACGIQKGSQWIATESEIRPAARLGSSSSASVAGGARTEERGMTPSRNMPRTRPGVVLDPFGGTGTTSLVASCYGRVGISVDLSADYCRLAQWRTTDPGERARVLGVEKPPVQVDGQLGLFEGGAA